MSVQPTPPSMIPPGPASAPRTRREKLKKAADNLNQGLGIDGVVQDSTRAVSLVMRQASLGAKAMRVAADLLNGEVAAVDHFVQSTTESMHTATAAVQTLPKFAARVDRVATPALGTFGRVFSVVSRYAQVIALPFAALDVKTAVKEHEPDKKRAAIANATFSVLGGLAGAIGGFMYASPIGLPLLVISTTTGIFQLLDNFAWDGKGMDFLGDHVVKPLQNAFKPKNAAAKASAPDA